jgi:hypothetical protein
MSCLLAKDFLVKRFEETVVDDAEHHVTIL